VTTGAMQITSIDISSKGNYLAGITDGKVIVWDPESRSDIFRIETPGRNIKVVRFKPDEDILAIGDFNGNVELWDIKTHTKISDVKAHTASVNDIRFNPLKKQMATASNDKALKIFNITDISDLTIPPISLTDNDGFVLVIQFSPDGQMIISGTYEGPDYLVGRPSHTDYLVSDICTLVKRDMTQAEWNTYVADDLPLESTCTDKNYNIKVNVKKQ
jgi:WD40 repeat protein